MPERMIVAPSVGVFRPHGRSTTARARVDAGRRVGVVEGPGTSTARSSPFRGTPRWACSPHPGERLREASPSPGCGSRERCAPASLGWGTAVPERASPTPTSKRASTPPTQWIVERTGIRERRIAGAERDDRDARDRRRRRRRSSAPASHPTTSTSSSSRPRRPEQPIPHTGAFVGEALGLALRLVRPRRRVRRVRLRARRRRVDARNGGYDHVLIVGAETLSRIIDPEDRATPILFGDGAGAAVLGRRPTTGPGSSRGTSAATARPPGCSRSRPAAAACPRPPRRSPTGEHYLKMAGQEVFRRAVRVVVESARATLERAGVGDRRRRVVRPAPGEPPHHRRGRQAARLPGASARS